MKKLIAFLSPFSLVLVISSLTLFKPPMVKAEGCGGPVPQAPVKVSAVSGPKSGEVTLYWSESAYADRYAVAYGTASNKYLYGANNIGGTASRFYTVKYLQPGVKYYFRIAAAHGCTSSPFSKEFSAVSGGGVQMVSQPVVMTEKPVVKTSVPVSTVMSSGPVGKQMLKAVTGPRIGQVTLSWRHADTADNYHLVYGTEHGKFQYGALNIGKITSFTVKYLVPGKTYHFALVPVANGQALYTTDQVMVPAGYPVEVVQTTKEALMMPKSESQGIGTSGVVKAEPIVKEATDTATSPSIAVVTVTPVVSPEAAGSGTNY